MNPNVALVSINNLTVRYGAFTALDDFSCQIEEGCTGLLGPNGAGKTTLLKTLLGFITPTAGGGNVLGLDLYNGNKEIRQKIGLMPEQDCHIPGLSAVGFVAYAGELAGMPADQALRRAHEVLEYCGLGEARYRNVETYSTGMKQRIKLAQAMIHGPKLLLLDEPTNGLDPKGREEMLDLIKDISHNKGVNVLISSHLLPDIERVCDRVVVVLRGKLVSQGTIRDLKKIEGQPLDVDLRETNEAFVTKIKANGGYAAPTTYTTVRVQIAGTREHAMNTILQTAKDSRAQVRGVKLAERSLEEAFLSAVQA
ncbi:MAG: ABC transporter ATP-binding protein [Fimbriimonas sp.]|nr:ABC transporter ATP-binding protein [Fimbriimonas sp.]